jgi:hypothetical protein
MVTSVDFNTQSKELAPAFYKNGLVYCSDRRTDFLVTYTDIKGSPMTNLYVAEKKKSGKFEIPRLFSKDLNSHLFEGPATFCHNGNTVYFTRTIDLTTKISNKNRPDTTFGIFSADLRNGSWSAPKPFNFNSNTYNTGYPFLTEDGNHMFFCSDAPGGSGGFDIYETELVNGSWTTPENLGTAVNTSRNEVFPFQEINGRLYFASRGHNNKGDLDIYFSVKIGDQWQAPVALGDPFNSASDDYGLILNHASDTAYFVSTRNGNSDIFSAVSLIPAFADCPQQKENDYCYLFYESNNNEIDTTAFAYEWDLGDGKKVRALEAEHCYMDTGTYLVTLNIIDKLTNDVLISQATYNFKVEMIEQPYMAMFDTVSKGEAVQFSARNTYFKDLHVENYYWDFGDGIKDKGIDARHVYNFPGTYLIKLGITGTDNSPETPAVTCVSRKIVVLNTNK